ncbi:MAG: hypothetical protein QM785_06235 [Pyrinomonadaceae bacterium]
MLKKIFFLTFFLSIVSFVSAQNPSDPKKDEVDEKLKKEAVDFLRETMADVNTMRSLENRLSFNAEMASLMWFHDEKEARAMYLSVTSDFRQLLVEFDTQLNAIAMAESADGDETVALGMFDDASPKQNIQRKLQKALEMRKQIAMSLAEHEPDLAMAFYQDSLSALTNPEGRKSAGEQDSYFEVQLMTQIAESNAAKAAQYGVKTLDKGVGFQHIELLKKIYKKDADKGIEFAQALISKIKSDKADAEDLYVISSLVRFGEETAPTPPKPNAKKPVMSASEMRDLVEVMARSVLDGDDEGDVGAGYMDLFDKYTPTRAVQIKAKYRKRHGGANSVVSGPTAIANVATTAANAATPAVAGPPDPAAELKAKALEEKVAAEAKLMEDVANLSSKPLPKDERSKIITQARKIISQTPGKDKKIAGLSLLAAQVAKVGDKELATEIMKDAERFVNPQPKNYLDFMLTWMLISGYAEADPDKAFPLLSDTVLRLNDTVSAFIKAAEFIDVRGEMIDDGEVQVGQFGGSMLRGLTSELKIAQPTLRALAKADFARTKAVTNTFDRPEVRVLAKMLVLRTILSPKETSQEDPDIGI